MERKEFMVELNGIIETIHTYTRNPFMMGYTKELRKSIRQNDIEMLQIVLDKVISWYNEEIEAIKSDEYIFNKNMHEKAYDILKEYREGLHA
ncbi:hypothetical protein [Liberiplasma polymorphum]|jgi:hypothetical protein|uniref:hypothetical protein n=1 Tax=Liberiplasma polymorphum TaxID=3374570 RepID=UPI003773B752